MSPFLQRLLKDHMLQAYIISAESVVTNTNLSLMFVWIDNKHADYWCECYRELGNDSQLTEEDVEYIHTNYPELFI